MGHELIKVSRCGYDVDGYELGSMKANSNYVFGYPFLIITTRALLHIFQVTGMKWLATLQMVSSELPLRLQGRVELQRGIVDII